MSRNPKHEQALELFQRGQLEDAVRLFAEGLDDGGSSELWNDWATAQFHSARAEEAERGYRRALELDPANNLAAVNLGILLHSLGRFSEAILWLERSIPSVSEPERSQIATILDQCRAQQAACASSQKSSLRDHPVKLAGADTLLELSRHILVVHEILPQTDRNGSDVRFMQVLRELRGQGHQVTYLARNGMLRERYAPALESLGITIWAHDAERLRHLGIDSPADWTFEELFRGSVFDIAILYMWFWSGTSVPEHYMDEIRRLSPKTRIAVLTEDQHARREMQLARLSGLWSDYERANDFSAREIEMCQRADLVLVISEDDRRGFVLRAPELNIVHMPMVAELAPEGPGFAERDGLLFLGNFDNLANRDGLEWLLAQVWPRLRKQLPKVSLSLVGHNLPPELGANLDGIHSIGHVADLDPLFAQRRVFVSPLRFGTGIKTKNLAALAHGLPLVTSTVGAKGMNLLNGTHALVADTPEAFADSIVHAYTEESFWKRLSREGRQHVADEFGQERLRAAVSTLIEQARAIPPKPFDPSHEWSYLLVEKRRPEVLSHKPARHRNTLRLIGYVGLAEEFLGQHRPAEALGQLEHMFGLVRGAVPANALFLHALALMARCCRELGDNGRAIQYEQAARQAASSNNFSLRRPSTPSYGRKPRKALRQRNPFELSVIIPTYNRRATLRACLANLAAQSLPPNRWQVIVVDDGSTDGTEELCHNFPGFYGLEYIRQENAGAGAARRAAVERARGEYLLLMNDDTIAHPGLLTEHLRVQYEFRRDKIAVLGTFSYPFEARERALTNFLSTNPFLFPQVTLDPGLHSENAYFIACNLSVRRDAVLAAGSFDPHFRVAEDTELGIRLRGAGYRVLYHPKAIAVHDHLDFTSGDLVRRARIYGRTQLLLLRKHPHLLGDGAGPFGRLDDEAIQRIREQVDKQRDAAREGLKALEKLDSFDLTPYFEVKRGERSAADEIMDAFPRLVPVIFWFFLFESFLQAWGEETSHTPEFSQAILADHT